MTLKAWVMTMFALRAAEASKMEEALRKHLEMNTDANVSNETK